MKDLRLNLGCGAKRLDGYINIDKFGNPDLRFDLDVDFELEQTAYTPSEIWFERYPESAFDTELLLKESAVYSNLIKDVVMTLTAIK